MVIVLDFDSTITVDDTINVLAQSAIQIHKERGRDLSHVWQGIVDQYVSGHAHYVENYPVPEGDRLDLEAESRYLGGMRDVEAASVARVEEAGLFDGISPSELVAAGAAAVREGRVVLRGGLPELLSAAEVRGWPVYVLSVNWSTSFLRGALHQFEGRLRIVSNEVHAGGRVFSPDTRTFLATAPDKLLALRAVLRDVGGDGRRTVYFGDSTTDIECLSMSSSGVVISSSGDSSLLRTLSRIGPAVPHVKDGTDSDRLLWARDFSEVLQAGTLSSPRLESAGCGT